MRCWICPADAEKGNTKEIRKGREKGAVLMDWEKSERGNRRCVK
jgi:hypothetical protein